MTVNVNYHHGPVVIQKCVREVLLRSIHIVIYEKEILYIDLLELLIVSKMFACKSTLYY